MATWTDAQVIEPWPNTRLVVIVFLAEGVVRYQVWYARQRIWRPRHCRRLFRTMNELRRMLDQYSRAFGRAWRVIVVQPGRANWLAEDERVWSVRHGDSERSRLVGWKSVEVGHGVHEVQAYINAVMQAAGDPWLHSGRMPPIDGVKGG